VGTDGEQQGRNREGKEQGREGTGNGRNREGKEEGREGTGKGRNREGERRNRIQYLIRRHIEQILNPNKQTFSYFI
jgi:hypothetical protein